MQFILSPLFTIQMQVHIFAVIPFTSKWPFSAAFDKAVCRYHPLFSSLFAPEDKSFSTTLRMGDLKTWKRYERVYNTFRKTSRFGSVFKPKLPTSDILTFGFSKPPNDHLLQPKPRRSLQIGWHCLPEHASPKPVAPGGKTKIVKSVTGYVQTKLLIHPKYPLCFLESINSATHVPMLDIFIRVFRGNQTTCEKKKPSLVFLFVFVALVTVHRMNKLAPSSNHQRLLRPPNLYPRRDLRGFQGQNGATRKYSLVCWGPKGGWVEGLSLPWEFLKF